MESSPLFMTLGERRIAFAHFDALYPTVLLPASSTPSALPTEPMDLSDIVFTANEAPHTLASLLQSQHLMGLVVIQDGKVRFEHYAPDHAKDTQWVTFSVTKSVTSLLIGAPRSKMAISKALMTQSSNTCRGSGLGVWPVPYPRYFADGIGHSVERRLRGSGI